MQAADATPVNMHGADFNPVIAGVRPAACITGSGSLDYSMNGSLHNYSMRMAACIYYRVEVCSLCDYRPYTELSRLPFSHWNYAGCRSYTVTMQAAAPTL
jgi:hypothetical protein